MPTTVGIGRAAAPIVNRGTMAATSVNTDVMHEIADRTGGRAYTNTNAIGAAIGKALEEFGIGRASAALRRAQLTRKLLQRIEGHWAGILQAIVDPQHASRAHRLQRSPSRALAHLLQAEGQERAGELVLHQGQVLAAGMPTEIRSNPEVQRVYLGETA